MDIVSSRDMQWRRGPEHRSGGVMFKDLFTGAPGPGNYWFTLVHVEGYTAPTHRHNFDQVRVMIEGGFGFGPQVQAEGTVGYFTAGVPYTQNAERRCVHLLLQCESGDAEPYITQSQIAGAVTALKAHGRFVNGHFIDESGAEPVTRDSFEACWEYTVGRQIVYPTPRYDRPVIMDPAAFRPRPDPVHDRVLWRRLGAFNERGLAIAYLDMEANAIASIAAATSPRLLYVLAGEGAAGDGDTDAQSWAEGDAIRLEAGEIARLEAATIAQLFCVDLPD
jgi:hypothetical protein